MQIQLSYADAVIGVNGANISYIRRTSGATIAIQETRGVPDEMTVEINGTASQVQVAYQLIQVLLLLSFIAIYNANKSFFFLWMIILCIRHFELCHPNHILNCTVQNSIADAMSNAQQSGGGYNDSYPPSQGPAYNSSTPPNAGGAGHGSQLQSGDYGPTYGDPNSYGY